MRNFLLSLVVGLALIGVQHASAATPIKPCHTCSSDNDFINFGAGIIFARHGKHAPDGYNDRITIRNPSTGKAHTIDVDRSWKTWNFGAWSFDFFDGDEWVVKSQPNDGRPTVKRIVQHDVLLAVFRAILAREVVFYIDADSTDAKRAFDIRNINVGEIHLGGEQFLWNWSPRSGGYATGANYFNIPWDDCSNCATESVR